MPLVGDAFSGHTPNGGAGGDCPGCGGTRASFLLMKGEIIDAIYSGRPSLDIDTVIRFQDGTTQRIRTTLKVVDLARDLIGDEKAEEDDEAERKLADGIRLAEQSDHLA